MTDEEDAAHAKWNERIRNCWHKIAVDAVGLPICTLCRAQFTPIYFPRKARPRPFIKMELDDE